MHDIENIENYAHENNVPIMLKDGLEYLLETIQIKEVKNILEIGTAIGYSAICMAQLDKDIQIDTLEIDLERYTEALLNIDNNQLDQQIHCFLCDAMKFESDKKYDLIFIDAAKSQYQRYMKHFVDNLSENGFFFFDNLNFHGLVDDPTLTDNRSTRQMCAKIKKIREWLLTDPALDTEFHPEIGDGVAVVSLKNKSFMIE